MQDDAGIDHLARKMALPVVNIEKFIVSVKQHDFGRHFP
jgi:hypothetical protein